MHETSWPAWRERLPPPVAGVRRGEFGRRLSRSPDLSELARGDQPLVSYVTVVRNAVTTIERTLASVRSQQWPAVEHIVVDGLSDDGTWESVVRNAATLDYCVSEPDAGLYDALNKAIPLARGQLICVLNADDWLTPDAAEVAARAHLQAGPAGARVVMTAAWIEPAVGPPVLWKPQRLDAGAWLTLASVCHNGVYATPGGYEASGPYATNLRIAADTRWLMHCVDAGVDLRSVDEPTVHYSLGGLSSDVRHHTLECLQILRERFDFLDESEAWCLLHAFHQYRPRLVPYQSTRPSHLGRGLAAIARRHAGRADLMTALVLASFGVLKHPDDMCAASRPTRREQVLLSLRKRWMLLLQFAKR